MLKVLKEIWSDNPLRTMATGFLCLFVGAALTAFLIEGLNTLQPPIIIMPDTQMAGIATPGGTLELEVQRKNVAPRSPVCDGSTDRVLWRWVTIKGETIREVAPFDYRGQANPFTTETHFVLDLPIKAKIEPGEWNFQVFFHPPCSFLSRLLKPKVYPSQVIPVHITAPDGGTVRVETQP